MTQSIAKLPLTEPLFTQKRRSKSFITDVTIQYGPAQLLGQFFLRADTCVRRRGIVLEFASIQDLVSVNEQNAATWPNMAQTLDSRHGNIGEDESYCLLGRNSAGEVVAAQAGRLYDLHSRTLKDIVDDASLYYGMGGRPENPLSCEMTAESARSIRGFVVYSGALWVRPDYRGKNLAKFLPRISRAYALATWGTDYTIAFMSPEITSSPLRYAYGYRNIEPSYKVYREGQKIYEGNLAWMDSGALADDLFEFSKSLLSEID